MRLLFPAVLLLMTGCQLVGPRPSADGPLTLSYTVSFGECVGYCRTHLVVTKEQQGFLRTAHTPALPDLVDSKPTPAAVWQRLVRAHETARRSALDAVYGCPDCADGGAATIRQVDAPFFREVRYEYTHPPAALEALNAELEALRRAFLADADAE